jgi:D-sedoheptulose 7-phosphate isomerase
MQEPNAPGAAELIQHHFREHQDVVARSLELLEDPIGLASAALLAALSTGHKVIAFGNGGSAVEASHLAGELLGRYNFNRQPFPALALAGDSSVVTCISNDFGYLEVFSRQLEALAQAGDVAVAFTTSGRSENVLKGLRTAHDRGATTIALTGVTGLADASADIQIAVPSKATCHIQEIHLMVLHIWCAAIDQALGRPTD